MNITEVAGLNETERFDDVEFNGTKFWFETRKHSLTPDFRQRLFADSKQNPKELAIALADVLTDWDVCSDDKGTKWPLTAEAIGKLPEEFLAVVAMRIVESWMGEKKPQGTSPNTSAASA